MGHLGVLDEMGVADQIVGKSEGRSVGVEVQGYYAAMGLRIPFGNLADEVSIEPWDDEGAQAE